MTVETIAANSLAESEKALDLIRGVISRENKVKDELRNLKKQWAAFVLETLLNHIIEAFTFISLWPYFLILLFSGMKQM